MKYVNIYNSNCAVFLTSCGKRIAVWQSGQRSILGSGDYNNEELEQLAPVDPMPDFRLRAGHSDSTGASMAYGPCLRATVEAWAREQAPERMAFVRRCN